MVDEEDEYKAIREKYPLIFSQRCELSIGKGWLPLVDRLCAYIQNHVDWHNDSAKNHPDKYQPIDQVVAVQIKEKFGGLRFYINAADDYIHGLISMAEAASYIICEECGDKGSTKGSEYWIRCLCVDCRKAGKEG